MGKFWNQPSAGGVGASVGGLVSAVVVVVVAAIGTPTVVLFLLDAFTPTRELPLGNSMGCLLFGIVGTSV